MLFIAARHKQEGMRVAEVLQPLMALETVEAGLPAFISSFIEEA